MKETHTIVQRVTITGEFFQTRRRIRLLVAAGYNVTGGNVKTTILERIIPLTDVKKIHDGDEHLRTRQRPAIQGGPDPKA